VDVDADAIVVGAGAAGLAAARSLAGRSVRVVLLDARDRVGGRVWSRPEARPAAPAELGAEFIHGRGELTMLLLREAGMRAIDAAGERWTCSKDGEPRREGSASSSAAGIFEAARTLANDESIDRFLRGFEADEAMRETASAARAFVEGFDAADPAIASARAMADEVRSGVDFAIARPLGGYRRMFDHLRDACVAAGVQIRLSTIVRRISWHRGFVVIDANRCGESQTIRARAAIVTLPVGVLRHHGDETAVVFDPDVPPEKREALRSIEMGHVVKVALWFRTPFWERVQNRRYRDAAFFRCERQPFPTYWTQLPVRNELVVAWVGGPRAIALSGVAEVDLIGRALDGFGAWFNQPELVRKEFEGGLTHDWSRDPFARGAYSYVAVGGGDAREVLAAPVDDTLFFAGEATSTDGQSGTVNGALETGERAAAEAVMSFGAKARRPQNG
jgi:monoamine oxidase